MYKVQMHRRRLFLRVLVLCMNLLAFINRISLAYAVIIPQLQEFIDPTFVVLRLKG